MCIADPLRTQRLSMDRTGADVFQRTASLMPTYRSPQRLKPTRLPNLPFEAHSRSTRTLLQSSQLPDFQPPALARREDQSRPRTSSSFMSGTLSCCVLPSDSRVALCPALCSHILRFCAGPMARTQCQARLLG